MGTGTEKPRRDMGNAPGPLVRSDRGAWVERPVGEYSMTPEGLSREDNMGNVSIRRTRTRRDLEADAREQLERVLNARSFEDFEEKYGDWVHARRVLSAMDTAIGILDGKVQIEGYKPIRKPMPKPKEGMLRKALRLHRMIENITLDVGEYLGLWGPEESGVKANAS